MLSGIVQICGETLSSIEVKEICTSVKKHQVTVLSLRKCKVEQKDFERLMRAVGKTSSVLQLNLNLGILNNDERVLFLTEALNLNRSIQSLFIHGNPLGDKGFGLISKALCQHPSIVSLDIGDCRLTDSCAKLICNLLPPDGAKSGIKELVLSANPGISQVGWSKLFCAIAASSCLRSLSVDYNPGIGDIGARMLAVVVAGNRTLQSLDLEGCELTNASAQIFLDLLENFPTPLKKLILSENEISLKVQSEINACLVQNGSSGEESA